jgi:hypothetical protein
VLKGLFPAVYDTDGRLSGGRSTITTATAAPI